MSDPRTDLVHELRQQMHFSSHQRDAVWKRYWEENGAKEGGVLYYKPEDGPPKIKPRVVKIPDGPAWTTATFKDHPPEPPAVIQQLAKDLGGKVEEVSGPLPDGSGFAVVSYPLPKNHWIYGPEQNVPPMPFRTAGLAARANLNGEVRAAARYAIRTSTMNGKVADFDPDAMVQNFVVGMLGYHTPDGLSDDAWANPPPAEPVNLDGVNLLTAIGILRKALGQKSTGAMAPLVRQAIVYLESQEGGS